MEEQLISFETAKLAKEKRFHEPCLYYFSLEGDEKEFIEDGYYFKSLGENGRLTLRPTQSLLQKWLREVHDIDISIRLNQFGYGYMYAINNIKSCENIIELKGGPNYKWTYEEALEIALKQSLKSI